MRNVAGIIGNLKHIAAKAMSDHRIFLLPNGIIGLEATDADPEGCER